MTAQHCVCGPQTAPCGFDLLPAELLHQIAQDSTEAYRGLILSYARFARAVSYDQRLDYMIAGGIGISTYHNLCYYPYDPTKIGIAWTRNGKCHRVGGPTVSTADYSIWYYDGKIHRTDGPAITCNVCNSQVWFRHGKIHREDDRPAVKINNHKDPVCDCAVSILLYEEFQFDLSFKLEYMRGWYKNGEIHREIVPAVVYKLYNGQFMMSDYWINGKLSHHELC